MIVPMKKICILTQKKDAEETLLRLRDVGVVHVQHENPPEGESVAHIKEEIRNLRDVIEFLKSQKPVDISQGAGCYKMIERISDCLHEIRQLEDDMAKRHSLINNWEPWGNFNPKDLEDLLNQGLCAKFFKIPVKALNSLPEDVICEEVFIKDGVARCLVICKEKKSFDFQEIHFPAVSLNEMRKSQEQASQKIQNIKNELKGYGSCLNGFEHILLEKQADLRLQEALAGIGDQEELSYLTGFCPKETCHQIERISVKEQWGLIIEEPSDADNVPTLLRNPKWIEIIKPVFSMMNILPGYKESDISIFFLLFLSIFFGMLIGDAGYGFIFFLTTLFAHIKLNKNTKNKNFLFLMYVFSVCTIVWGLFTGTIFGQAWIKGVVQPLVPWLNDVRNMQMLCFLIGTIHLSIAHIWRGILRMPSLSVLSELGWISILWGMFFVAKMLILGNPLPSFAPIIFGSGAFFVIFFSSPSKNILKMIGAGLGGLVGSIVNMFTDIVSYIRLFAVGLASVAVADAFNQMAMGIGFQSVFAGIAAAMILLFGHLLNIALGAMAILVHGIRLNVLEFSSHLNMEWSGVTYNPFRKINDINE